MKLKTFLSGNIKPLTEGVAKKSDVKKMEAMADDIVKRMKKLNAMFKKTHDPSSSEPSLYNTFKDWEDLTRDVDRGYGGWFGYVYDSDYVGDK